MRPLLLSGEHELTIDEKNRMLIPADIRKNLLSERDGDAFYALRAPSQKRTHTVIPLGRYDLPVWKAAGFCADVGLIDWAQR